MRYRNKRLKTMKKLTLIRHAKSSWQDAKPADIDRPLNKRGRDDASMMAQRLAADGFSPGCTVTSSARRALQTAEAFAAAIDFPVRELLVYGAGSDQLLGRIRGLDNGLEWVAMVGHNPAITDLVRRLSGEPVDNIPTCGVAQLDFDIDRWRQVGEAGRAFFLLRRQRGCSFKTCGETALSQTGHAHEPRT